MADDGLTSLPDQPLTDAEIQAVQQHPSIEFCFPVYRLKAEPDEIITITIGRNDQAHLLLFDPEEQHWKRLLTTEMPNSVMDQPEFDDEQLENQLQACYDEDEIEPAGYPNNPLLGLIQKFPEEPLSEDHLDRIRGQPMIQEAIPLIRWKADKRVITLILVFDDIMQGQRIVAGVGYNPDDASWHMFGSVEGRDSDREEALDELEYDFAAWIANRYSLEEIEHVENPEELL